MLTRPGEYEIRGVFVTGIQTWRGPGASGEAKEENTVFVIEFGDLMICHLGDLSRVLDAGAGGVDAQTSTSCWCPWAAAARWTPTRRRR